jgi:hypothetical protein
MIARHANIKLCAALIAFVLSSSFFYYRWYVEPNWNAAEDLYALTTLLEAESTNVVGPTWVPGPASATVPELLARIQEFATAHNIHFWSMAPDQGSQNVFALNVSGAFSNLVLFLGRLETLQLAISTFEMAPRDAGAGDVSASIVFHQANAAGVPSTYMDYFEEILSHSKIRNPFADAATGFQSRAVTGADLTWVFHLTGITLLGAERFATIDGRDYLVGDQLSGMIITEINESSVRFSTDAEPAGKAMYFRSVPGGQKS